MKIELISGFTRIYQTEIFMQEFEHLKQTENPHLYAIRHPRSQLNERYLYVYEDGEKSVLLTAFSEKNPIDYKRAIERATNIYEQIEWEEE